MKKWIVMILLVALCLGLVCCIGTDDPTDDPPPQTTESTAAAGQVRILNMDPNLNAAYEALAAEYFDLTGTQVKVISAVDEEIPTLRTVTNASQLPKNCVDLSQTAACGQLASQKLTLQDDAGQVCAVAADVEVFGLVYNSTLLAKTSNTRSDIQSFSALTEVVYGITDRKATLGFSAFAQVDPDDRFALQLASMSCDARNLVDLILNNTTGDPLLLVQNSQGDALQEFLKGKVVFFLAGSREQETLEAIGTENMGVIPVYTGGENEENQSLCAVARSYWCVDADASEQDVAATLEFLDFLICPRADGSVPVDDLGRMAPYRQAARVSNLLESVFRSDLAMGKEPVVCRSVSRVPEGMTEALIAYAENPSDENWNAVVERMAQ